MFMFIKKQKKACGIELINEVMERFTSMIDELNTGVCDCQNEQADIRLQIESLNQRDVVLNSSIEKAETITRNLQTLVGE